MGVVALAVLNGYRALGRVTRRRLEVIIGGTDAAVLDGSATWQEYPFMGKPGDPLHRCWQVAQAQ